MRVSPRNLIVKFFRCTDLTRVFNNKRNLKPFNNNPSNSNKIFINEALTIFMQNNANFAKIELFIHVGLLNANPLLKQPNTRGKFSLIKITILPDSHDLTQCYLMLAKMKRGTHLHFINRDSLFPSTVHQLFISWFVMIRETLILCFRDISSMLAVSPRVFYLLLFFHIFFHFYLYIHHSCYKCNISVFFHSEIRISVLIPVLWLCKCFCFPIQLLSENLQGIDLKSTHIEVLWAEINAYGNKFLVGVNSSVKGRIPGSFFKALDLNLPIFPLWDFDVNMLSHQNNSFLLLFQSLNLTYIILSATNFTSNTGTYIDLNLPTIQNCGKEWCYATLL